MKVLGILGSPRPNGNTATLLGQVLAGAAAQGAATNTIVANHLTIRACQSCDACKKTGHCIVKDDMYQVYSKIDEADVVILASPNYMGGISGNLKPLIDRLYPYIAAAGELHSTIAVPKKVMLLITQNAPAAYTQYQEAFTPLRGVLNLIFQGSFDGLADLLLAPEMKGPQSVANDAQLLDKAYAIGEQFVR